jgi:hypothetical protein
VTRTNSSQRRYNVAPVDSESDEEKQIWHQNAGGTQSCRSQNPRKGQTGARQSSAWQTDFRSPLTSQQAW